MAVPSSWIPSPRNRPSGHANVPKVLYERLRIVWLPQKNWILVFRRSEGQVSRLCQVHAECSLQATTATNPLSGWLYLEFWVGFCSLWRTASEFSPSSYQWRCLRSVMAGSPNVTPILLSVLHHTGSSADFYNWITLKFCFYVKTKQIRTWTHSGTPEAPYQVFWHHQISLQPGAVGKNRKIIWHCQECF
jgi:hypothetical protein